MTTTIKLKTCDYWASCRCGHSMRIPSPSDSTDKMKMPVFCCGCGKRIIFTGKHRHLPHELVPSPPYDMNWGGKRVGDKRPECSLCGLGPLARIHREDLRS